MPVAEKTRHITQLIKELRGVIWDKVQTEHILFRLNGIDTNVQFNVAGPNICVRLRNGCTHAPISIVHAADYVEILHRDGSIEVLKDQGHITDPFPSEPDPVKSWSIESVWDRLMADDGS